MNTINYRINPHFQSVPLIIVEIAMIIFTASLFLRAYLKTGNKSALCMFSGGIAMAVGYIIPLAVYLLFPDNYTILAWGTNILAEIFFFMGWTYFTIAGIFIFKGNITISYALVVMAIGLVSVFAAAIFFKPYELTPNGMNFNRNFLIDFTQYLLAVILVMIYGNAFRKGFSQFKNKVGVLVAIIGTAVTFIGSNIVTLSPSPQFAVVMQVIVVFGICCIVVSIIWLGRATEPEKNLTLDMVKRN